MLNCGRLWQQCHSKQHPNEEEGSGISKYTRDHGVVLSESTVNADTSITVKRGTTDEGIN